MATVAAFAFLISLIAAGIGWLFDAAWLHFAVISAVAFLAIFIQTPNNQKKQRRAQGEQVKTAQEVPQGRESWNTTAIDIAAKIRIEYEDAGGASTTRDVDVHQYLPEVASIEGYCHLRNEARTFRLDRIKSAVDLETGEVLSVTRMRSWLRKQRA